MLAGTLLNLGLYWWSKNCFWSQSLAKKLHLFNLSTLSPQHGLGSGSEVRGLEPSCCSWKDQTLKQDLQMSAWTHLNSLSNDLLSPPEQQRLFARLRQAGSLRHQSRFKSWIRKLDRWFSFDGRLGWQGDALIEMSPALEIVSSAAERLLLLSQTPTPFSVSSPQFPTHMHEHTHTISFNISTHRESQGAFCSLQGFDFTSYK